jgi:hypothetical protein
MPYLNIFLRIPLFTRLAHNFKKVLLINLLIIFVFKKQFLHGERISKTYKLLVFGSVFGSVVVVIF